MYESRSVCLIFHFQVCQLVDMFVKQTGFYSNTDPSRLYSVKTHRCVNHKIKWLTTKNNRSSTITTTQLCFVCLLFVCCCHLKENSIKKTTINAWINTTSTWWQQNVTFYSLICRLDNSNYCSLLNHRSVNLNLKCISLGLNYSFSTCMLSSRQ